MLDSDLKNKLTYTSYLKIQELLSLQEEKSEPPHHDEMLFILIHQIYELWFKQIIHELHLIEKEIENKRLFFILKSMKRIAAIQDVLIQQVSVLETMSPNEFAGFRENLNPASGFQSHQFRLVEFKCGLKNNAYLKFHEHMPEIHKELEKVLAEPSIYDQLLKFLGDSGFDIPDEVLNRNVTEAYKPNQKVEDALFNVYQDPEKHADLYYLFEAMLDIDSKFQIWRFRHVKMVERMIGSKMGTGGSSGAEYLKSTLPKRFFPELWTVRDRIGSY